MLTCRADGVGVLVLCAEHGLLHHAQEDDPGDPELDAQQVLPVAGGPHEPQQRVQDVRDAHHHVELGEDETGSHFSWVGSTLQLCGVYTSAGWGLHFSC